jgi:hypothetical protein
LKPEDFIRSTAARVEAVRVISSALNPMLWLTGIVSPLSLVLAVSTGDVLLREALLGLAILPVLVTIVAYCVFIIRDPDRLQSEEYRLRRDATLMIYKYEASPETLKVTSELARLEDGAGGRKEGENQ